MLTHSTDFPTKDIFVDRADRQRKQVDIGDLIGSIRDHGILQPLLIQRDGKLIFGERRWTTAKFLDLEVVPVRFVEDLSAIQLKIIEHEENVKRKGLTWQEHCCAVSELHEAYEAEAKSSGEEWKDDFTARQLNMHITHVRRLIKIGDALRGGDESLAKLPTMANAVTTLERRQSRQRDAILNSLDEGLNLLTESDVEDAGDEQIEMTYDEEINLPGLEDVVDTPVSSSDKPPAKSVAKPLVVESPFEIKEADLFAFAKDFSGPKFNFLHLDLPYGVELKGFAYQSTFEGGYKSNPDIYWAMLEALVEAWPRLMLPSSHFMCWISMKFYSETIEFLEANVKDIRINPTPLIWHKTDNKGIIADPQRGGRNVYEACLFGSTGDRKIVKPVSNVYGCPTNKTNTIHPNEKPIPMLEHFFQQFVDGLTRGLDPTAGSGSSIRCLEKMKAECGLGLEFDPEFAKRANERLLRERGMAHLAEKV